MFDRGYARLAAWLALALLLTFTLYQSQLIVLSSGLDQLLSQTLGSVFPAYPFLALLILLTALRWRDLHKVLLREVGLVSMPLVRFIGGLLIVLPAVAWYLFSFAQGEQPQYLAMEFAACSLVLVAFGSLLAVNPRAWRLMLPYASLYASGLVAPLFLLNALGAPMASLSSYVAADMTNAAGLHVAWQGVTFAFVSNTGQLISAVVTPACSAVYSMSIYLALLGLAYLDIGSSTARTVKFAIVGIAVIPILDSGRIALTIWFGFVGGSAAFWSIHDWLGYAIFFAFYVAALVAYSRRTAATTRGPALIR